MTPADGRSAVQLPKVALARCHQPERFGRGSASTVATSMSSCWRCTAVVSLSENTSGVSKTERASDAASGS